MSVSKDKKTDKWMVQIRVKDWTGKIIHKKKSLQIKGQVFEM